MTDPKKLFEHARLTVEDEGHGKLTFIVADEAQLGELEVAELLRVLTEWQAKRWENRASPPDARPTRPY